MILQPESAVRRVPLPPGSLTIGRALPSALLLEGVEVSRAHCRIDVAGDEVSVTDLNSTNGTFLDNKRLAGTAPLLHGDVAADRQLCLDLRIPERPAGRGG